MFLNSLLLFGTALGAIPVIIHLLNKRRFRPVTWAAMEFLLQAVQKNSRRLQLRDIILMLIRMFAIICLALALARPAVSGRGMLGAGTKTGAIILLDNSMSMGYNNGRETRFDVAKRLAKTVLNQLKEGSGTWCALLTFNDDTRAPLGDPSTELSFIEQELERSVQLSDGGTNVEKALLRARKIFESKEYALANKEIYIITDMQSRAWNPREVSSNFGNMLKEISADASIFLINAGDGGKENAGIVDLTATDTLAAVDTPIQFVVKIQNFGQTDLTGLPVDFYIHKDVPEKDARPTQRSTVNVKGGESAGIHFEAKFGTGGDHKVEVRIPDDRLMGDNRRYSMIEVIDDAKVLLVDGRDRTADDPLSNESGFLRFALSPRDFENPEKQSPLVTETVAQHRFSDRNLLNYQTVVLANVAKIPQNTLNALEKQVKAGMGLMIFLGDQVEPQLYNSMLGDAGVKLLPAKVGQPWGETPVIGDKSTPESFSFSTASDKLSHPIMSDFNNPDFGAEFLSAVKMYRGFDLTVTDNDENVRVVAWLSNGKPAVVEKKVGSGYVLLFAFPATTAWGNLPTQPAFTIMMLRAVNMLTLGNRAPRNIPVTAPIRRSISMAGQRTAIRITPPAPGLKKDLHAEMLSDGRVEFEHTETDRAGFYDIVIDRTPKVNLTYAVNSNPEVESNLDVVLPTQLKQNYPGFDFSYIGKAEDFASKLQGERRGTELWPLLIGLVFGLLALESILANRWAPRD